MTITIDNELKEADNFSNPVIGHAFEGAFFDTDSKIARLEFVGSKQYDLIITVYYKDGRVRMFYL